MIYPTYAGTCTIVFIVAATIKKRLRHGNIAFVPTVIEQEFGGKFDNYMTATLGDIISEISCQTLIILRDQIIQRFHKT